MTVLAADGEGLATAFAPRNGHHGADAATRRCASTGIRLLRVVGPAGDGPGDVHVLVPRSEVRNMREALESEAWRYELGAHGLWRFRRTTSYGWDDGTELRVHAAVPAGPLPSAVLRRLESVLWERARRSDDGVLEPDRASSLLFLAVQALRPGFQRERDLWRARLARCASAVDDWDAVWVLARRLRLAGSLRLAMATIGHEGVLPDARSGFRQIVWVGSCHLQQWFRPRRLASALKAQLAGTPLLDRAKVRCRFADVELVVPRKVFVPRAVSEALVRTTLHRLEGEDAAVVAEAGTGCGAVALALAAARPGVRVHAVDRSRRAVRSARRNGRRAGDTVRFYHGSLLEPIPAELQGRLTVVVSNVPYVPPWVRQPGGRDAPGAVEGTGVDGLGLVRQLAGQALRLLAPGGWLVLQLAVGQWDQLSRELRVYGYEPGDVLEATPSDVVVFARAPVA